MYHLNRVAFSSLEALTNPQEDTKLKYQTTKRCQNNRIPHSNEEDNGKESSLVDLELLDGNLNIADVLYSSNH